VVRGCVEEASSQSFPSVVQLNANYLNRKRFHIILKYILKMWYNNNCVLNPEQETSSCDASAESASECEQSSRPRVPVRRLPPGKKKKKCLRRVRRIMGKSSSSVDAQLCALLPQRRFSFALLRHKRRLFSRSNSDMFSHHHHHHHCSSRQFDFEIQRRLQVENSGQRVSQTLQ
jgi:hypothetical protein